MIEQRSWAAAPQTTYVTSQRCPLHHNSLPLTRGLRLDEAIELEHT